MNAIIELKDICAFSGDFEVIPDLSVTFFEGRTCCLVGKAGSGKSTLLKVAAGLLIPERGQVIYKGRSLSKMNRSEELEFRKKSAFAFQDSALWGNQSIYNNLSLPLALHEPNLPKAESDKRVLEIARRVGYSEGLGFRPVDLSIGEQKLISLARALILNPELLFLDEPTSSLDEDSVDTLLKVLKEYKSLDHTIIAVTHDSRLIAELSDDICVVAAGGQ
ncbi:amino acid ABC transporter ATP-binding protein [Treponema sp.]